MYRSLFLMHILQFRFTTLANHNMDLDYQNPWRFGTCQNKSACYLITEAQIQGFQLFNFHQTRNTFVRKRFTEAQGQISETNK